MGIDRGSTPRAEATSEGRTETCPPAISIQGLEKVYGDEVTALAGVSFDIESGSIVGLLGPNGAGKTTLIKSMLDLVTPTEGERSIFGYDVDDQQTEAYNHVGAMFEGARNVYWRLTVKQNLEFFTRLNGSNPSDRAERFDNLLEQLNLDEKRDTRVRNLSRGQKQKVALASVLTGDKDLVFLDEPTLGLDVESSNQLCRELTRLVDQTDLTVVLSSHDMDVIEDLCDRAIILNDGEVLADDSIENLLDVFNREFYEISLNEPVPSGIETELRRDFDVHSWNLEETGVTCRVSLSNVNRLHNLTGIIINAGGDIDRVDAVERDFEDVFLELTGDTGPATNRSGSENTREVTQDA